MVLKTSVYLIIKISLRFLEINKILVNKHDFFIKKENQKMKMWWTDPNSEAMHFSLSAWSNSTICWDQQLRQLEHDQEVKNLLLQILQVFQ